MLWLLWNKHRFVVIFYLGTLNTIELPNLSAELEIVFPDSAYQQEKHLISYIVV